VDSFPLTLEVAVFATVVSTLIAIPLGTLAAIRQDTWVDYIVRVISIGGLAIPNFWTGILLILFLVIYFQWSPPLVFVPLWEDRGRTSSNCSGPSSPWATAMPR
jgi:peptide/nickel transport system permease protein